jgi:Uma2 family endonuclease
MPTVVMVNAPDSLLDERRSRGLDHSDEMWDGVIHLVPPAGSQHGQRQLDLGAILKSALRDQGLQGATEIGVFRPGRDDDYRVPDLAFGPSDVFSDRGIEGAATLVVEIRSPRDESWQKVDFYAEVGVEQVLIIDPAIRRVHLLHNREGTMVEQQQGPLGDVQLDGADVQLWFDGDRLVVQADGHQHVM